MSELPYYLTPAGKARMLQLSAEAAGARAMIEAVSGPAAALRPLLVKALAVNKVFADAGLHPSTAEAERMGTAFAAAFLLDLARSPAFEDMVKAGGKDVLDLAPDFERLAKAALEYQKAAHSAKDAGRLEARTADEIFSIHSINAPELLTEAALRAAFQTNPEKPKRGRGRPKGTGLQSPDAPFVAIGIDLLALKMARNPRDAAIKVMTRCGVRLGSKPSGIGLYGGSEEAILDRLRRAITKALRNRR